MPRIRPATLRDLDVLVAHRRGMWEDMAEHAPDAIAAGDAAYRRWLRPRLASGRAVGWIVEDARGRAQASGVVWLREVQPRPDAERPREPYLMSMFTERDARGRGHATRIVRAAMAWAAGQGYPWMRLHASAAGRPIYEGLGFARTHEMKIPLSRSRTSRR